MSSQSTGFISIPHELSGDLAATPQELRGTITSVTNLEALLTKTFTMIKLDENFSLESENGVMNKTITQALLDLQAKTVDLEDSITESITT